ncbi:DUF397 domain-containing protein [Streptomyces sp. NPDC058855]|uniref:DUF397 domain-containing protein n=1 Tax=Streptomyces sp. NPDC058855 TaxID=3346651 RepID=UPI0036CF1D93
MGTDQNLTGARWRKSSYSSDTGGNCVECAPLGTAAWRKSSYSSDTGGDCVEVADLAAHVHHVRRESPQQSVQFTRLDGLPERVERPARPRRRHRAARAARRHV